MSRPETGGGAARLRCRLAQRLNGPGLSHAYLLAGGDGAARRSLGRWLAAAYVCTEPGADGPCGRCSGCRKAAAGIHPDIVTWGAEDEGPLAVAQARALRTDVYIRPNEGARKVYVLDGADKLPPRTQDVLLKVLEEGPPYAAFLLLAENDRAMLATVRSRCWVLNLGGDRAEETLPRAEAEPARQLAALLLAGDELALVAQSAALEKWDRAAFAALLEETATALRETLAAPGGDTRRVLALCALLSQLREACNVNAGVGHLLGWLTARAAEKSP